MERKNIEGDIGWLVAQTAAGPERTRIIEAIRVRSEELDALETRRENARLAEIRVQDAAARGVYYHTFMLPEAAKKAGLAKAAGSA